MKILVSCSPAAPVIDASAPPCPPPLVIFLALSPARRSSSLPDQQSEGGHHARPHFPDHGHVTPHVLQREGWSLYVGGGGILDHRQPRSTSQPTRLERRRQPPLPPTQPPFSRPPPHLLRYNGPNTAVPGAPASPSICSAFHPLMRGRGIYSLHFPYVDWPMLCPGMKQPRYVSQVRDPYRQLISGQNWAQVSR